MIGARTLVLSLSLTVAPALSVPVSGQTLEDGIMLEKGTLFTGGLYTRDRWNEYWEGALKRDNGNIGTLTTQTNVWFANYGLTDRLNLVGTVPYVWTQASQGVLHGMRGVQDLTVAAKYSLIEQPSTRLGTLRVIGAVSGGIPLTDYTPDFQPLSIGSASKRLSARFTFNAQSARGWFANWSAAHTWRGQVTLDRPYYYTDDRFFVTDEVAMPRVFDHVISAGYLRRGLMFTFLLAQQRTLGGGDIRRQDMPFVSNRANFSKTGAELMYPIPALEALSVHSAYLYTIAGRNVGQASRFTIGLLYRFGSFERSIQ
jgi:hypothetical protein